MRKIVFTLVTLLSFTAAFAGENGNAKAAEAGKANVNPNYEMNIDTYSLATALRYTSGHQADYMGFISSVLAEDTHRAASAKPADRDRLFRKAIYRNIGSARSVLDAKQYRTYLAVMQATLQNRGLSLSV